MKKVLFTPDHGETMSSRNYQAVTDAIGDAGFDPQFVPVTWEDGPLRGWAGQLDRVYDLYDSEDTILAGHGVGGILSLVSAAKRSPAELWVFSLPPVLLREGISPGQEAKMLPWYSQEEINAFRSLSYPALAEQIDCPARFLVGEQEEGAAINQAFEACAQTGNSTLGFVAQVGSQIDHPNYVQEIVQTITFNRDS